MEEANESDLLKTQMDLVDLSGIDSSSCPVEAQNEEDSVHPSIAGSRGFCVKEYEEEMQSLKKDNFNLKLRIYFLEEKNPNVPVGAEALYKQNIDLKVENENLLKEVREKQDLLCQASKALELLDEQKSDDLQRFHMTIDELNQKIESLQHEVTSLQNALVDANKSNLGNDTGFTDFLGAVDSKDIDCQRKMLELNEIENSFKKEKSDMNNKIVELQRQKNDIEMQLSGLLYENDEIKDKFGKVEKIMNEELKKFKFLRAFCNQKFNDHELHRRDNEFLQKDNAMLNEKCEELEMSILEMSYQQPTEEEQLISQLEADLSKFKDKWASAQCDLQDTQEKLKETEKERTKTLTLLQGTLQQLEEERLRIYELETQISDTSASGMNKDRTKSKAASEQTNLLKQKNHEIDLLKDELGEAKRHLQMMTSQELSAKNREIEKLQNMMKNMQLGRSSLSSSSSRFSLEQLSESFNDLKFQQAMEEKKISQKKIDELMGELVEVANTTTRKHVNQLQEQMKIVVEKQEVTDSALGKCADLCAYTLDHLHDLARFLSSLLQQREIRESLDELSLMNIQSAIDKTLEFSQNAGRFSTVDGRMSSLPDISSLDLLMTSARHSLANVRDVHNSSNKSVQASDYEQLEAVQADLETAKKEVDEINRVNQLLEDEICHLKEMMEDCKSKMSERDTEIVSLKSTKDSLNSKLQDSQNRIQILTSAHCDLENKLQEETVKKFECETRLDTSESMAAKLQEKLDTIRQDLEMNWITKSDHDAMVKKLEEDIVNGEAQVAAIRMEMDMIVSSINQMKAEKEAADEFQENKENMNVASQLKTLEISEDRLRKLSFEAPSPVSSRPESPNPDEAALVPSTFDPTACRMCPKYQAKIFEYKKYLTRAMDKIKRSAEKEKLQTRNIQKQLSTTETVLQTARTNMDKILKHRESNQNE